MTDFKEYSAAFHDHQNELMHYGVKGMKWHKKKRRQTETDEEKKNRLEKERAAADTVSAAGRGQLGVALLKGVYDAVPKKSNKITGSLKSGKLTAKKTTSEPTKEELLAGKKKRRGKYKRGLYAERKKA